MRTKSLTLAELNQTLSENRAGSASDYLILQNVLGNRISTIGYSENQPVVDSITVAGKAQNRRIEVAIFANDKQKRAAKRSDIK